MMTYAPHAEHPIALVTGASRGLGRALADALADRGWRLIIDGRDHAALASAAAAFGDRTRVEAVTGDVADAAHRRDLAAAVRAAGGLDLLVNNAGSLGPSPRPALADVDEAALADTYSTNAIAPLLLFQAVRAVLDPAGVVINITSDAARAHWPGWGVYGSSKAALEHLTGVLAAEHPQLAVYTVDPGDLRTAMHQAAFPGEDISDRLLPEAVVPAVLSLVSRRPASGRYRVADLPGEDGAAAVVGRDATSGAP